MKHEDYTYTDNKGYTEMTHLADTQHRKEGVMAMTGVDVLFHLIFLYSSRNFG